MVPDHAQRDLIAETAWSLFLESGYGGTAMSDVAAKAHVSLRTIYRLFPGKPELFAAVVAIHRRSMLALPGDYDALPVADALARIFQTDLAPEAERQRDALMTMFIVECRQFPELMPILHKEGPESSRRLLADWLERQRNLGRIGFEDADLVAGMLMDVVFGAVALKTSDFPAWPGGRDRWSYLRSCFRIIVEGLTTRA
ncbi:TetR/AcrR family transcriptional regulator [Rhizobium halophytocola]|uniref:AcrR family transcriptional regulator n=1 Tax=Rhizobium halophytocola TaxID=735519 RepID=A0ABS4DUW2_9HYPH|nr:AcrR family transcriptional regulator [Rhizobium halophytocola]